MAKDKLSDPLIRNAKPGEKAKKLFDGGGLYLELQPSVADLARSVFMSTRVSHRRPSVKPATASGAATLPYAAAACPASTCATASRTARSTSPRR